MDKWDFAGWGRAKKITNLGQDPIKLKRLGVSKSHANKLGQWKATAICGNDITSSCLYVSALAIIAAGAYAPLALLIVAFVLFLYRKIYAEVGSALPLNGGTYTVLLNTTNKKMAAGAACLTLLSYIATAVISGGEAMHYANTVWKSLNLVETWGYFNIELATISLLGFFAILSLMGISESATVAVVIFVFHLFTLTMLVVAGIFFVFNDPSVLMINYQNPLPEGVSITKALYLGFAAAMLGISGFESSANFIEEQKKGVFPKTLRNMWISVSIFNPIICFLALCILTRTEVEQNKTNLLAIMADRSVGTWLKMVVSIDAVLVLSGAVITSYVGVTGLVRRMSLDRCLPDIFLKENKWRETNHWIIIAFFVLCCSIFLITKGDVTLLAGVYTLSFLGVMALFSIGNMLLKQKRSRLPRDVKASWFAVIFALIAVLIAILGNFSIKNLQVFLGFFSALSFIIIIMFLRVSILKIGIFFTQNIVNKIQKTSNQFHDFLTSKINIINSQTVIFFSKGDNMANLNIAALYVLENEHTTNLMVVTVYKEEFDIQSKLASHLHTIDHLYPHLKIDFIAVKGEFGPDLIERLSIKLKVPKNYMFIGTPGDHFPHELTSLGGVRLIM